ncbi:MAG: hypothetical protein ABGY41_03580 [Candidatus Poribacteria bacterium]
MIFVPPSQHGDGERSGGPILLVLLAVAVVAGLAFYRRHGGEFSIEGFRPRAAMWIVASLGMSLAVAVGIVTVQRRNSPGREASIHDRLASMEDEIDGLRQTVEARLDSMSRKVDEATRAIASRDNRRS